MEDEGRIRTRCYEKSAFVTKFRDHPTSSRAHSCIFVGEGKLVGRRTLNELVVKCLCNFSQRPSTSSLSIERQEGAPFSSLPRDTLSTKSRKGGNHWWGVCWYCSLCTTIFPDKEVSNRDVWPPTSLSICGGSLSKRSWRGNDRIGERNLNMVPD